MIMPCGSRTRRSICRCSSSRVGRCGASCASSCAAAGITPPAAAALQASGQGQIPNKVMISERPAEVADRAVPGHWEGDLLLGKLPTGIATLVERQTRYCQLVELPDGHGAEAVRDALISSIGSLPEQLRRSLTWDQGKEMREHAQFTIDSGIQIYFCDPAVLGSAEQREHQRAAAPVLAQRTDLDRFSQTSSTLSQRNSTADRDRTLG